MIQIPILRLDEAGGVVLAFQSFGGQVLRRLRMIPERLATPFRRGHMVLADTLLVSNEPRVSPGDRPVREENKSGPFVTPGRYRGVKRENSVGGRGRTGLRRGDSVGALHSRMGAAHHARNKWGG